MIEEIEEYYEFAGFEDYYNRVLKYMSEQQILKHYKDTFDNEEDQELE